MKFQPSDTQMTLLLGAETLFVLCVILRAIFVRRLMRQQGGIRQEGFIKQSRAEWKAIKAIPSGSLRNRYNAIMGTAIAAWIFGVAVIMISEIRK